MKLLKGIINVPYWLYIKSKEWIKFLTNQLNQLIDEKKHFLTFQDNKKLFIVFFITSLVFYLLIQIEVFIFPLLLIVTSFGSASLLVSIFLTVDTERYLPFLRENMKSKLYQVSFKQQLGITAPLMLVIMIVLLNNKENVMVLFTILYLVGYIVNTITETYGIIIILILISLPLSTRIFKKSHTQLILNYKIKKCLSIG